MQGKNDKPLITFGLFVYNQERFIQEAVKGAFAQTYSTLEIVLSDDCSSDRTFAIMSELAKSYHGPHTIILNRNNSNFGIEGHVNRIMEIGRGKLIVAAAGDDISLPERTENISGVRSNEGAGKIEIMNSRYLYICQASILLD